MRKNVVIVVCLLVFLMGCTGEKAERKENGEKVTMQYYYYPTCEGCTDGEGFAANVQALLADVFSPEEYVIELKNVAKEEVYEEFQEIVEENKTEEFYPTPPVMVMEDKILFGLEEIEQKIRKTTIECFNDRLSEKEIRVRMENIPEEDSYFVYFYKKDCKYCDEVEQYLSTIEKELQLSDGSRSKMHFTYVDIGNMDNMPIANEFYKKYKVPEEEWKVPMLFWKGGYLKGSEQVKEQFLKIVLEGKAKKWPGVTSVPVIEN